MTLTMQQIWERYSEIDFVRRVDVCRINTSGVYENDGLGNLTWTDINTLVGSRITPLDVCKDISKQIPDDTYSFGAVTIDNADLLFENPHGEVSDELNINSIFYGYIRHNSMVRIVDGYMDKYTAPTSPTLVTQTTFEGFIDDKQCETSFDDQETIVVVDKLVSLLQRYTKSDLGLSGIYYTSASLILTIMNRSEFTEFFTVNVGNINPGWTFPAFDMDQYEGQTQILTIMQDIALAHSLFYLDEGIFYFSAYQASATVDIDFSTSPERKIKFKNYNSGAKRVFDRIYWETGNAEYNHPNRVLKEGMSFNIKGVTNVTDQQNYLNYIGPTLGTKKALFELTIPFLPTLKFLNRASVTREGIILPDSFLLDVSQLDVAQLVDPTGAIIINSSVNWIVRGIKHTKKLETILTLEKIVNP